MKRSPRRETLPGEPHVELGENHCRAIGTVLGLLDETLCGFERWAEGHEAQGVLYREHNVLSPAQREEILRRIKKVRIILRVLRDDLKLEPQVRDVSDAIWCGCAVLLDTVVELGSRYLGRYGPLPKGLAEYLDPRVKSIVETVRDIGDAAKKRP
jgi:hypothetical protein